MFDGPDEGDGEEDKASRQKDRRDPCARQRLGVPCRSSPKNPRSIPITSGGKEHLASLAGRPPPRPFSLYSRPIASFWGRHGCTRIGGQCY